MLKEKGGITSHSANDGLVRLNIAVPDSSSFHTNQPAFEKTFNRQMGDVSAEDTNTRLIGKSLAAFSANTSLPTGKQKFLVTIQEYFKNVAGTEVTKNAPEQAVTVDSQSQVKNAKYTTAIQNAVSAASQKYGVDKKLIESVIKQESAFNPNAVSHCGAQGLMQLMPKTAKEVGVKNSFDIDQNVDGGTQYLKKMLDMFGGDQRKALAAYNAGPGAVQKHGGVPPYKETRNYVARIMSLMNEKIS